MQENSENKKSSKEMWLFLIFLDIAALCVFAYFIYNSFGGEMQKQFAALSSSKQTESQETSKTFVEEILVQEDILPIETEAIKPTLAKEEIAKEEAPLEQVEITNIANAPAEAKKQSVFISGVGKTRKVTFKYYDEAKKVAIISGFTNRKPVNLTKKNGVFETTLILYPGDYKYMYIVDNVEVLDPNAPAENGRSVLKVR